MKYKCECCGKTIERTPITCSDRCRMKLKRSDSEHINTELPEKCSINEQSKQSVRKANKIEEMVEEKRFSNPFEICKKHGIYKQSCGCK